MVTLNDNLLYSDRATAINNLHRMYVGQHFFIDDLQFQKVASSSSISDMANVEPVGDEVYADHFGENTTPGTTDMTAAINAALTYQSTRGRIVRLRAQTYLCTSQITFPTVDGMSIVGVSTVLGTQFSAPCAMAFTNTSGAMVKMTSDFQKIEAVAVRAVGARAALSYSDATSGVLVEPPDTSGGKIEDPQLIRVFVEDNPGDGVLMVGDIFQATMQQCSFRTNKGRPIHFNDGTILSRTNLGRSGGFVIHQTMNFNNGGPATLGNRGTGTYGIYRGKISDCDNIPGSLYDASLFADGCLFSAHGENLTIENMACGGRISGTPTLAGISIAGRHHRISGGRFVGCTQLLKAYEDTTIGCGDILLDTFLVTNDSTFGESGEDPAVAISGSVGVIEIKGYFTGGPGAKTVDDDMWFPASFINGIVWTDNKVYWPGKLPIVHEFTVADDAFISVAPPTIGGFADIACGGKTSFPNSEFSGTVWYDTGSSLQTNLLVDAFPGFGQLDTSTGALTGTTGTDGNVTISSASGLVYLENRSGSSRSFKITFR